MRKFKLFAAFLIFSVLGACTDNGPETWSSLISDSNLVTGQVIRLQVYSVTNNPPMSFAWNDNDSTSTSTFQDTTGSLLTKGAPTAYYSVYWTAPDTPGQYSVTCSVTDKLEKADVIEFSVNVIEPSYTNLLNTGFNAYTLGADKTAVIGGIYAVVNSTQGTSVPCSVRYFSANTRNSHTGWSSSNILKSLFVRLTLINSFPTGSLWGGYSYLVDTTGVTTTGLFVTQYGWATSDATYSKNVPGNDSLNDVQVTGNNIWVSADSGFYQINSLNRTWTQQTELGSTTGIPHSNGSDFSSGIAAIATSLGVYYSTTGSGPWTRLPCPEGLPGCWTNSVVTLANPPSIYALSSIADTSRLAHYISTDGTWEASFKPGPTGGYGITSKLSRDSKGRIWCGKNRWSGTAWDTIPGIDIIPDSDPVRYSIVSPEGLVYFLTSSGSLWVRGKTP